MAVAFLPTGWAAGRVAVPGGAIDCPDMTTLVTEINKVLPGGSNAGDSVVLSASGLQYGQIGLDSYDCSDGGDGFELYFREDGASQITHNAAGSMGDAHSALFRLKNGANKVSVYNGDFVGNGSLGTSNGAIWGGAIGGSYDNDPNRGDVFDVLLRGCRFRDTRQSGVKIDGDGGTDGVTMELCTVDNTGLQYTVGSSSGFGEGVYVGDGNTGRAYSNVTVTQCEVMNVLHGEAIEGKRNGTNVVVSYNHVHDVVVDSGGAIKFEGPYTARGNRVHAVSTNVDSDSDGSDDGDGIEVVAGALIENNIVWDVTGDCVSAGRTQSASQTTTCRNNTLVPGSGHAAYSVNTDTYFGSNNNKVDADGNIYIGTLSAGTLNGSTFADYSATTGDFVGPTTGTADSGDGPGSGFQLLAASGAVDTGGTAATVPIDITTASRGALNDYGAIESNATPDTTPPTPAWTFPADGQFLDTGATVTFEGTVADAGGSGVDRVSVNIRNVTTSEYLDVDTGLWSSTSVWRNSTLNGSKTEFSQVATLQDAGSYIVRAVAYDNAGNQNTAVAVNFTVETRDYEIVVPSNNVSGVATVDYNLSGNAPFATTAVWVRITNEDDSMVLTADATTYVADTVGNADDHWLPCVYTNGGFSYGPYQQPQAKLMKIDSRRTE